MQNTGMPGRECGPSRAWKTYLASLRTHHLLPGSGNLYSQGLYHCLSLNRGTNEKLSEINNSPTHHLLNSFTGSDVYEVLILGSFASLFKLQLLI